jgi:prepilin-type N-terminal cleavage/methylation domain-containing protein/prepilin-type processing-associated H-X9-DG protein
MSLPRRGSGRRAGFTLVELLVVTSVLAVLSGMLLPVFARARERGREAACRSHIRQLGMGLLLYTQDYDGQFPSFWVDPLAAAHARQADYWHDRFCAGLDLLPGQPCWVDLLQPYLRSERLVFCPSDGRPWERPVTSYEYKPALAQALAVSALQRPAAVAAFYEQWSYHGERRSEYDARGGSLIAFADGHVAWKRLSDSTSGRYHDRVNLHWLHDHHTPEAPCDGRDFVE